MIFFLGIKGAGMAALACMLHEMGEEVEGSDLEKHFFTEEKLLQYNIKIHPFNTFPKDGSTVIIGNAFKEDNDDVKVIRANSTYTVYRYHEYLGKLLKNYHGVAITGSHGKTTTTKMMTSLLSAYKPTAYLIGDGNGHLEENSHYCVIEADEYRRFFLSYFPEYAVITNVDYDHVDYYKDEKDYASAYEQFALNVSKAIMVYGDDPEIRKLDLKAKVYTYGLEPSDDLYAKVITENEHETIFELTFLNEYKGIMRIPFSGRHLLWNALGCIGIGLLENMPLELIEEGLGRFENAARRFKVEVNGPNVYIDDYAHHPTEVSVTIDAARLRYPNHKLIAIFKPHRVSRLFHFADAFAKALDKADEVYLCGFSAIDDQEVGYDITIDYLKERSKKAIVIEENDNGAKLLNESGPAVYLFMSSKDIYGLANLLKVYQNH
ncbi:MAG TPA: Mur ligase family protein [Erysipelotrichaceae bacterium]|nr:Mur ligase family protein [Erysipelotrichaceae bacterium]